MRLFSDSLRKRPDSELKTSGTLRLQALLEPQIRRTDRGNSNSDVRLGFHRMLDFKDYLPAEEHDSLGDFNIALPDDWKALIRGAVREDPHIDCDEKEDFYKALDLGVPSSEEHAAWSVDIGHTSQSILPVLRSQDLFRKPKPSPLYCSDLLCSPFTLPRGSNADSEMSRAVGRQRMKSELKYLSG